MKPKNNSDFIIDYMITSRCNLSCDFCYGPTPDSIKELNKEQKIQLIEKLYDIGVTKIIIAGGEPTLSSDLISVCQKAKEYGIGLGLQTNAFFESSLEKVLPYLDWVALPIDGVTTNAQLVMRSSRLHLAKTLNALSLIKDYNQSYEHSVKVKIGTVICQKNFGELERVASILNSYEVDVWKIYQLRKRGKGKHFSSKYFIEDFAISAILKKIMIKFPNLPIYYSTDKNDAYVIIDPDSRTYIINNISTQDFGRLIDGESSSFDKTKFIDIMDMSNEEQIKYNISKSFPGWI